MHTDDLYQSNKTKFVLSTVALIFCFTWALTGVSDMKIVASSLSFMSFLYYGIKMEMSSLDNSH